MLSGESRKTWDPASFPQPSRHLQGTRGMWDLSQCLEKASTLGDHRHNRDRHQPRAPSQPLPGKEQTQLPFVDSEGLTALRRTCVSGAGASPSPSGCDYRLPHQTSQSTLSYTHLVTWVCDTYKLSPTDFKNHACGICGLSHRALTKQACNMHRLSPTLGL